MAEGKESNEICPKCGVAVREHTSFCYSCGADIKSSLVEAKGGQPAEEEANTAEETREADKASKDSAEKRTANAVDRGVLAKAARERRKARVSQRKLRQYVWEPLESPPTTLLFIVAAALLVFAGFAIYAVLFLR